jgi:16S rRNA (cytidine1402-2'-O)-methyltransferase
VCAVIAEDLPLVCLPGPCAAVTALVASGLPPDRFHFAGFLPRQGGKRAEAIARLAQQKGTLVLYEAPHRAIKTLRALAEVLGERRAALGWNLTKPGERYLRGTLTSLADELASWEYVHGEMTLVIEGAAASDTTLTAEGEAAIRRWIDRGADPAMVRELVADLLGVSRNEAYAALVRARNATVRDEEE